MIVYLDSVERNPFCSVVKQRVEDSVRYFPEIDLVYVGMIDKKRKSMGICYGEMNLIALADSYAPTYCTIFHELFHIVQWQDKTLSQTEAFCSIAAMSRMPPELVDEDYISYVGYGTVSPTEFPRICRHALAIPKRHNYIAYTKKAIAPPDKREPLKCAPLVALE